MTAIPIPYLAGPATVTNQALDMIGRSEMAIGDVTDGTAIAEVTRRTYGTLLRQLLRTAHWNFARKQAAVTLLGDATGQTPNISTQVDSPWTYAYAWPIDGAAVRWMPALSPQLTTTPPLMTGFSTGPSAMLMPGRFLVSSSDLYPVEYGIVPWDQQPDLQRTEGVGPISRRIILSDIPHALMVYTRLVTVIEEWDSLFLQAMVSLTALALVPVAITDPKERMAQRNAMIAIAKNAVADARVANGNEAGYPQTTNHQPIWITARGGWANSSGIGGLSGYTYFPWDSSMQWCGGVF